MRPFWGRMARPITILRTWGIGERSGGRMRVGVLVAALVTAALVGGLVLAGGTKKVGAERYSAYADPEKPVISYLLSDPENVEDFQREFALNDGEMADVLDAVRRENEILAGTFSRSERIVQANRGLSEERVGEKIAASSFDESVRAAVAGTKGEVKRILPPGRRSDFRSWVDARWQEERQEFDQESSTFMTSSTRTDRGRTFRVYATQYRGHTLREAALPHRKLKFEGGYKVRVRPAGSSDRGWVKIKDVGPWNTYDNWFALRKNREMWRNLPRGMPEAQAAYFDNFHRGRDEFGRKVLNPAGIDLTPAFAREIGLGRYESGWVYVHVPWVHS